MSSTTATAKATETTKEIKLPKWYLFISKILSNHNENRKASLKSEISQREVNVKILASKVETAKKELAELEKSHAIDAEFKKYGATQRVFRAQDAYEANGMKIYLAKAALEREKQTTDLYNELDANLKCL